MTTNDNTLVTFSVVPLACDVWADMDETESRDMRRVSIISAVCSVAQVVVLVFHLMSDGGALEAAIGGVGAGVLVSCTVFFWRASVRLRKSAHYWRRIAKLSRQKAAEGNVSRSRSRKES